MPNQEIGTSPGWLPIDDPQKTFTTALRDDGYWTAQVSDNPFIAFMKAVRAVPRDLPRWQTIVGQSGFRQPPENVSIETVHHWLPPFLRDERYVPGMRKYLANTGEGRDEEETCAARVFKDASDMLDDARRRQPFALTVDCFDPHEPWSTPKKYLDLYGDPGYEGPEVGVTPYGFARNFTPELLRRLHAAYAGEVTHDGPLARPLHGALPRAGPAQEHRRRAPGDHGYLLGERGYTGKVPSQLHPELAQVPFVIVHPDGRAAGTVEPLLRLHPRRGPDHPVDGRHRPAGVDGRHRPLADARRRRSPREKRDFHYGGMYNRFYIRTDDWVLIGDNQGNERTLCDLRVDPHEFENVVKANPAVSKELYDTVLDAAGGPLPYYE